MFNQTDLGARSWSVRKLHPRFGAALRGHNVGPLLERSLRDELIGAVHEFGVVVLPDQDLSDQELLDFASLAGTVHWPKAFAAAFGTSAARVTAITNLDGNGEILPATENGLRRNDANELWHTDSTRLIPRALISMLHAKVVPPVGADTEFCDTRCTYEDLDPAQKAEFAPLIASHSLIHSRALTGFSEWTPEERLSLPPIDRPLVHLHRETGRMALCLAAHIADIKTLPHEEAQRLVWSLIEAATLPESVYTHKWRVGDLLLWDNRCTMHRARPYDQLRYGRDLRTIRLDDEEDPAAEAPRQF